MFIVTSLSDQVLQAPPTFASWLPVQISAGNQTQGMKVLSLNWTLFGIIYSSFKVIYFKC